jgi:dTDP-glucose pyrophosphorylase
MISIALIPAAGKGTRMLPNTRSYPKELMEFGEKPVIEHVIAGVKEAGVKRFLLIVGHKKGAIIDYIGDGHYFGVSTDYIFQEEAKGLGHAILSGHPVIEDDHTDFLVCFGDNIINPFSEISNLVAIHEKYKPLATVMTFKTTTPQKYGVVKLQEDENGVLNIVDIKEKPQTSTEQAPFKYEGMFHAVSSVLAFNVKIFDYLRKIKPGFGGELQITDAIGLAIANKEKILSYQLNGEFIDIGGWEYLKDLKKYFLKLTDEKIDKIIIERNEIMEKLKKDLSQSENLLNQQKKMNNSIK